MGQGNGQNTDVELMQRMISLVARLNDALRDFSEEQRRSSERLERVESEVEKARETLIEVKHHLEEARDGIERVREETNPRIRVPPGAQGSVKEGGEGFEITDKQVRLPNSWATALLKLALSAGAGGLALRFAQWLMTKH